MHEGGPRSLQSFETGGRGTAEPVQSKQEQLPDVCRAVDKNESEGEIEIAATTSAVEDDRTTPVTEASIPASELVHQNNQEDASCRMPNRGGVFASLGGRGCMSTEACGTRTRHF